MSQAVATIASGANAASNAIQIGPAASLVAIHLPAGWVTSNVTFQGAPESGGTYSAIYKSDGSQVQITSAAASRTYSLVGDDAVAIAACEFIKLVSVTDQTADRTVLLSVR